MDLQGLARACARAGAVSSSPTPESPSWINDNPLVRVLDSVNDGRRGLRRLKVQLSRLLVEEEDDSFLFWKELPQHYAEAIALLSAKNDAKSAYHIMELIPELMQSFISPQNEVKCYTALLVVKHIRHEFSRNSHFHLRDAIASGWSGLVEALVNFEYARAKSSSFVSYLSAHPFPAQPLTPSIKLSEVKAEKYMKNLLDTCLKHSAFNLRGDCILVLLKHGADIHAVDDWGNTALDFATKRQEKMIRDQRITFDDETCAFEDTMQILRKASLVSSEVRSVWAGDLLSRLRYVGYVERRLSCLLGCHIAERAAFVFGPHAELRFRQDHLSCLCGLWLNFKPQCKPTERS
eukprot:752932-Hanusia_phi.AAC.6